MRIDDVDTPRVRHGAEARILEGLERLGLAWDGPVLRQRDRGAAYADALARLHRTQQLYACACTRRETAGRPYPGTCRDRDLPDGPGRSLRLKIAPGPVQFPDAVQGPCVADVARDTGDIILRRADGVMAYHLAAVVDDHWQGVTDVVRGVDLLAATGAQCSVYGALGLTQPAYCHLPLAVDERGGKISKRLGAEDALLATQPARLLFAVLQFLGQVPEPALCRATVTEVLEWAVPNWRRECIPRQRHIPPVLPP